MMWWFITLPFAILATTKCAWNYRFDEKDNHFNIVYPDKNAVYFGMILPSNTTEMIIESESHPFATYFSVQIYEYGDLITSLFDYRDIDIVSDLRDIHSPYTINAQLTTDAGEPMVPAPALTAARSDATSSQAHIADYLNASRLYATSSQEGTPAWTLRVHMRRRRKTPSFTENNKRYFALFRIYGMVKPTDSPLRPIVVNKLRPSNPREGKGGLLWAGIPPHTYINGIKYPLCDIDYDEQGNIYSNITREINPKTHTVCDKNDVFLFMDAPAGSLANADANYMIACVSAGLRYRVSIQLPKIMCYPDFYGEYDVRYASLSIVSTTAPRPTVETYVLPCNTTQYSVDITIDDDVPFPGLTDILLNLLCQINVQTKK